MFLTRLRRRTGASEVHFLIARPEANGRRHELFANRGRSMRRLFPMAASYRAWPAIFGGLRPGRVYSGRELADIYLTDNRHRRSALRERGSYGHLRLIRVVEAGGLNCWLAIGRALEDFTAAEAMLLSSLAGHVAIALQYLAALRRERFIAAIAGPALSQRGIGWIMLDRNGHVLDHDAVAARLFDGLSRPGQGTGGQRRLLIPGGDEAVAKALDAIAHGGTRSRAICTSDASPIHLLVRPAHDLGSGATAILYAQERTATRGSEQVLIDLFGLTRSEARLALMLANGRSLVEAGTSLGLTRETVRSYSKSLYAKTGTHGQGGLVRVIVISLATLFSSKSAP